MPATSSPAARRLQCPRCARPGLACLCSLVVLVANQMPVLVLQHPAEQGQTKGTASLLRLSLANCRVMVGEVFEPAGLRAALDAGGRGSILLYPDAGGATQPWSAPAPVCATLPGGLPQLVLLDATWRKSLKMLHANPGLHTLPRWPLPSVPRGPYGQLRKARHPDHLSTLEACCHALAQAEQAPARYAGLLLAFEHFVATQLARVPRAKPPTSPRTDSHHKP
jgi:DTW domain-containing protein